MNEMTVHYLWNTDPEFDGMSALCDHVAGLDETPRQATLSDARKSAVTCSDCLALLDKEKA